MEANNQEQKPEIILNPNQVDNAVLKRLIEEVKYENDHNIHSYNRSHNRHNRSMASPQEKQRPG